MAIADPGRGGEVRFLGEIPSTPEALHRLVERLKARHRRLSFCYEAGPCGYGVHRLLSGLDQECSVVAPSLIPTRPGDRVKTNRRDATALAKLHPAGELTPVWVPDAAQEALPVHRLLGIARRDDGVGGLDEVRRRVVLRERAEHPDREEMNFGSIAAAEKVALSRARRSSRCRSRRRSFG